MECVVDKGQDHSLTGGRDEFVEMGGEHIACYKLCGDSLYHAMSAIITTKAMKWTCWYCRSSSSPPKELDTAADVVCPDGCGHTGADTLREHLVVWLRAIKSLSNFTVDKEKTLVPTNFSDLGEKLLYPHGLARGMLALADPTPVAEDRLCACEVAPEAVTDPKGATEGGKSADGSPAEEDMDTSDRALPKLGNEPLLKKLGKSCKIENLLTMAGNGYSKALLSQRLSGAEAKEGLCISVYLKHQTENPGMSIPTILPKSLPDLTEKVLKERLSFLEAKSTIRTKAEKEGADLKLHEGVSKGLRKRKLSEDPNGDGLSSPPAKKPKVFTLTIAEMVKIMGQFVQATTNAGSDKLLNAHKTMETIVARNEQAKKSATEVQITEPEVVVVAASAVETAALVTAETPVVEQRDPEPTKVPRALQSKVQRGKGNQRSVRGKTLNRPIRFPHPPPQLGTMGARGRSGTNAGREVRDNNMSNRVGSIERSPPVNEATFNQPIRCTNSTYGKFCGSYNFVEAPYCKGCGIAYPNGLPRELSDQRPSGGFGRQGGMGRDRNWNWKWGKY